MIAFIAIFLTPVLMVVLWEKIFYGDNEDRRRWIVEYTLSVLMINTFDLFIVSNIFGNTGSIVAMIAEYSNFAIKYIMMSCSLAVGIPYAIQYCKKHIRVAVNVPRVNTSHSFQWRLPIIAYTLILFLLNLIRIYNNNFWGDEAFSIRLAKMSVDKMLEATARDVHPPLYYLLLIGAYKVFGEHGWVFHMVSIVPYAIGLIFILTVIWKKFGKGTALLMVTFTSIMSAAVTYNVEVRMYSLAMLFVLLSYYAFYLVVTREGGKITSFAFFILASLGAAYSHYYAMMSVAFFYLALLVLVMLKRLKLWQVIVTYVLTILGYLPWFPSMIASFSKVANGFWMTSIPSIQEGLLYFFDSNKIWYSWGMLGLSFFLVFIFVLLDKKVISIKKSGGKTDIQLSVPTERMSDVSFWLLWGIIAALGTLALGELISVLIRPVFITKYLYPVVVVIWMVLSVSISRLTSLKRIMVPLVIIITFSVCMPQYSKTYKSEKSGNEACMATVKYMNEVIKDKDVMLTDDGHLAWTVLPYYMPEVAYKEISADFSEFDANITYWLVWTKDISEEEAEWLNEYGYTVTEVYHAGNLGGSSVHLYQMDRE